LPNSSPLREGGRKETGREKRSWKKPAPPLPRRPASRLLGEQGKGKTVTTEEHKMAMLGRDYWQQYVQVNGYSFEATEKGLKKLSRNLDLNIPHLRKCINKYLEA
jgi:hypothetical protein